MAAAALLLFLTSLLSLSVSSSSRPLPCNTLLISYSFTSYSSDSNSDSSSLSFYRPSTFITVYRIISPLRSSNLDRQSHSHPVQIQRSQRPSSAHLASSLQDRARDILAVAAGLLFGVGCGALTAATLYFLFAVATNRYALLGSHYDDDEDEIDEYDEIPSPKKGVYVTIPVEETTADVKVKEGFEKN
ncbi:hypothetical protein LUZ60_014883 [Juncus effusus]|nr:hypothetical protein LUZ60_014883 [Juncus effusus]